MSQFLEDLLEKYKNKLPSDYITAVVHLSENNIDRRFLNDSDVHARLLIDCMIGASSKEDEIRIYSGELKAECYSEVLRLSKTNKIRILVDDYTKGNSVLQSSKLDETEMSRISILPVAEKTENHFYTVGDKHFRYEIDHGKASAVANFFEPETVAKLNARFDEMWNAAEQARDHKESSTTSQPQAISA